MNHAVLINLQSFFTLPMWLIAVYVPGMRPANRYWIPLSWIGISVWFIQAFTVFIPCYQVFRHQTLQQETLIAIATWEARTRQGVDGDLLEARGSSTRLPTVVSQRYEGIGEAERGHCAMSAIGAASVDSLFTMQALESTLDHNPEPLRRFASLRDFSGENVSFLMAVRQWKALWLKLGAPANDEGQPAITRQELFKRGLQIYANYVSPKYAVFPLNLSARDFGRLHEVFAAAARLLYGDSETSSINNISPFDNDSDPSDRLNTASTYREGQDSMYDNIELITQKIQYCGFVPHNFSRTVFGAAEKEVKCKSLELHNKSIDTETILQILSSQTLGRSTSAIPQKATTADAEGQKLSVALQQRASLASEEVLAEQASST